jgi:UDP-N-acetylmuramoylalanine-D-glutamate ligase
MASFKEPLEPLSQGYSIRSKAARGPVVAQETLPTAGNNCVSLIRMHSDTSSCENRNLQCLASVDIIDTTGVVHETSSWQSGTPGVVEPRLRHLYNIMKDHCARSTANIRANKQEIDTGHFLCVPQLLMSDSFQYLPQSYNEVRTDHACSFSVTKHLNHLKTTPHPLS